MVLDKKVEPNDTGMWFRPGRGLLWPDGPDYKRPKLFQCDVEYVTQFAANEELNFVGNIFTYSILDDGSRDGCLQFSLSDKMYAWDMVAHEVRAALVDDNCLVAFFARHITSVSKEDDDPKGEIRTGMSPWLNGLRCRDSKLWHAVIEKFQGEDENGDLFWNRVMDEIDCDLKIVPDDEDDE